MTSNVPPPAPGELPWPAPREDYQLLELDLEWGDLDDAQARVAPALRLFVITRDPLDWIPDRGVAWATATADGDTLELPIYVLHDEVLRRLDHAGGDLAAALAPIAESVLRAGAACESLLFAGAYADLVFRGQTPALLGQPAEAAAPTRFVVPVRSPRWAPVGLGAVQDLVQEAFGPVNLDRSAVRLTPSEQPEAHCPGCAGTRFGFPAELETAESAMCSAHRAEARAITVARTERARKSNPAGWRALGKGSARVVGYGDPVDTPMPERHSAPVGRNDPCPCGSGRKYKQCCGR